MGMKTLTVATALAGAILAGGCSARDDPKAIYQQGVEVTGAIQDPAVNSIEFWPLADGKATQQGKRVGALDLANRTYTARVPTGTYRLVIRDPAGQARELKDVTVSEQSRTFDVP